MEEPATLVVAASTEYVGRWNRLISTTNWEKGRIIFEWREALSQADAPAASYTDEAWSRQVENVSPQHVGRLRRVYERFGSVHEQYAGLYWSHFQVAIEWPDAEMYLQGAVESGWSVSQMRNQRWEVTGGQADSQPQDAEIIATEFDEDVSVGDGEPLPSTISESFGEVHDAEPFDGDAGDVAEAEEYDAGEPMASDLAAPEPDAPAAAPMRPFELLPPLPADLKDAFELMKLAILNHKVAGWREIARDDVLAVLESLRQLVLAPAE
jgi:hypothetical protein